jgi:uncharacterized membrane protein YgcG
LGRQRTLASIEHSAPFCAQEQVAVAPVPAMCGAKLASAV